MTRRPAKAPLVAVPAPSSASPAVFEGRPDLEDEAKRYTTRSQAENTTRARKADWGVFTAWCEEKGVQALPAKPADVAAFLTEQARTKATATVVRYGQTISAAHERAGLVSPTKTAGVKELLAGIKNVKGVKADAKAPLTLDLLERAMPKGDSVKDFRDRALLLFGFATALRRSNIVAVDIEDLTWSKKGAIVEVRRSKTDQEGVGTQVALPRIGGKVCPATSVEAWIGLAGITTGPLFRGLRRGGHVRETRLGDDEVREIVRRAVESVGLDGDDFGGHSLRAGYVTTARQSGQDWTTIMAQTGHKLLTTVKKYSRYTPEIFDETKAADVFKRKTK